MMSQDPNNANKHLPSAVQLLEQQIDRRKATGQRFSKEPASIEDTFRSARRAPNEQVRMSVRQHPSNNRRIEPPIELPPRDQSPPKFGPGSPTKMNSSLNQSMAGGATGGGFGEGRPANQFRVNVCQRVEAPKDLNAPPRVDAEDPDAKKLKMNMTGGMGPPGKQGKDVIGAVSKRQASNTKMKDQELLAFACRRANKTRSESLAYYSMGVLHDNEKEYSKAVLCYEQYLQACRGAGDAKGEQLALNSIGIALHNMGEYDRAIDIHSQHREVSDIPGKFVAHTNIGIAFMELKDLEQASLNHRQALRYAIVMSSLVGESLACGNLGIVGEMKGDLKTAKACMERHLKLAAALKDIKAQLDACGMLGKLANQAGEFEDAAKYYEQARTLAMDTGNARLATNAKCMVGISRGNAQFEDYIASLASKVDGDDKGM